MAKEPDLRVLFKVEEVEVAFEGGHKGVCVRQYLADPTPRDFVGVKVTRESGLGGAKLTIHSEAFDKPALVIREPDAMLDRFTFPGFSWPHKTYQSGCDDLLSYRFLIRDVLGQLERYRNWKTWGGFPEGVTQETIDSLVASTHRSMVRLRSDFQRLRLWEQRPALDIKYPPKPPSTPEQYALLLRCAGIGDVAAYVRQYIEDNRWRLVKHGLPTEYEP